MGRVKTIQICQNDAVSCHFSRSFNSIMTELLHHTYLITPHLNTTGLLHRKWYSVT